MARRVFYSFHYELDNWRASQLRNIGAVRGNRLAAGNKWESVKRSGDRGIERWIQEQLHGKTCTVVLIGEETASRKWIQYEIRESWQRGMGVIGIHIRRLKDRNGKQCAKGENPFEQVMVAGLKLSDAVKAYNPAWFLGSSRDAYSSIAENLTSWIEKAIEIRSEY